MKPIKAYISYGKKIIWWLLNFWRFKRLGLGTYFHVMLKITPKCISCGKGVFVWKHGRIEGIEKYNKQIFNPHIVLKDRVSIQQNVHITCANSIVIGQNTAIAANVTITDIHHPYEDVTLPIESQDIQVQGVFIGEDCKIYNNAVILPGTTIGRHCTIGANSVVSGNYPDFCVLAGTPARIIKRYNSNSKSWEKTNPNGSFIIV